MKEENKMDDIRKKYRDVIVAWANGKEIQFKSNDSTEWIDLTGTPNWNTSYDYRVKPEIVRKYIGVYVDSDKNLCYNRIMNNIVLEVEDDKIKSVSLLDEPVNNDSKDVNFKNLCMVEKRSDKSSDEKSLADRFARTFTKDLDNYFKKIDKYMIV